MSASGKSSPYRGVTLFRPTMKWRAQISADGKTTSLGDHDTEELAAVAFDRACINKAGLDAKTNFPLSNYENEIEDLRAMSQLELVAMLRAKARKSYQQTSHFRGVSLLKQTNKWHAQINIGGRQVHLGFFPTEEFAARAYDRAAINKGAKESTKGKIITNFDITDYVDELDLLRRISQDDLVEALSNEGKRKQAFEAPAEGEAPERMESPLLGRKPPGPKARSAKDRAAVEALCAKAERAQPKSTARNPLYLDFGKKKAPKLYDDQKSNEAPSSSGAVSAQVPVAYTHIPQASEANRPATKLGRLFAGATLPSLEGGPAIALPLIDQATGAPAAVVSLPYPSIQPPVQPKHLPNYKKPAKFLSKSAPKMRESAQPKLAGSTGTGRQRGRPPKKRPLQPQEAEELQEAEEPQEATALRESEEPETAGELSSSEESEGDAVAGQTLMPSTPGNTSRAPKLPASSDPKTLYGASAYARYAKFLGPEAEAALQQAQEPAAKKRKAKAAYARPKLDLPKSPELLSPSAAVPPTPPPKRQRTSLRQAAAAAASASPSAGGAEGFHPDLLGTTASQDKRVPARTLHERLRQQRAEHKKQQAEQRALVSEVIDHLMNQPNTETSHPLTKRQEALAAKKQEEAAATLAAARQQSPLPDVVGDALMDFAAAAELAELEDQEQDAGRVREHRSDADGVRSSTSGFASATSGSTVTDSDVAKENVGKEAHKEFSSRWKRSFESRPEK